MKCSLIEFDKCLHKKGHYVLPQQHQGLEVVCYIRGSGVTTIGGEKYDFKANDIAIIPPNTEHDEMFFEDGLVLFCIVDYEDIDTNRLTKRLIAEEKHTTRSVYETMNRIIIEYLAKESKYQEFIDLLLQELLVQVYRLCEQEKSENDMVLQAKQYMKMMYVHPIDFNILAETLGYSYDRLRHIFKKNTGISMKRYLTNVRISRAQRLLINSDYSIERIALMCGYSSTSNFIVSFKSNVQVTPSQYRENVLSPENKENRTIQF